MGTKEQLENIIVNGETSEIQRTAEGFLQFLKDGSVGSNSVGLIYFIQQPESYVEQFGDTIIGVT